MSKESDAKAGLLGKVAKFIKNPTLDWADIDRAESSEESPPSLDSVQSRQALKDMLSRKKRNDLVRKREFEVLRKIRRKGKTPVDAFNVMDLSSMYSSSQMAQDEEKADPEQNNRERTLRQIDEIEAQLSRSWFNKTGGISPTQPIKYKSGANQPNEQPNEEQAPLDDKTPQSDIGPALPATPATPATPAAPTRGAQFTGSAPASGLRPPVFAQGPGPRPSEGAPGPLSEPPTLTERHTLSQPSSFDFTGPHTAPPILTQSLPAQSLYPPSRSGVRLNPANPKPTGSGKLSSAWRDSALDGMTVDSDRLDLSWEELTASDNAPANGANNAGGGNRAIEKRSHERSSSMTPPNTSNTTALGAGSPPRTSGVQQARRAPAPQNNPNSPVSPNQPNAPAAPAAPAPAARTGSAERAAAFDNPIFSQLEVLALRQDPEIEAAALSYANGDDAAAENILLNLLSAAGGRREDVEVWLALFDLYRVTGQYDSFNGLVSEFTLLFGRSAPQWDQADMPLEPQPKSALTQSASARKDFLWTCPSMLNARALTALTNATRINPSPWRIDWHMVQDVDAPALLPLMETLNQWAQSRVELQFHGQERLLATLARKSPTEDKQVNPAWWNVRLALLRLMDEPDRFDQTALDFCITYEISPLAWAQPQSTFVSLSAEGEAISVASEGQGNSRLETLPPTLREAADPDVVNATLQGRITGSIQKAMSQLPSNFDSVRQFDFDCSDLARLDFDAAGELLNWCIQQQSQGRTVILRNVHRLLASFLTVMGLTSAATVALRKD